jgi:carboxyl-terminal processing protease
MKHNLGLFLLFSLNLIVAPFCQSQLNPSPSATKLNMALYAIKNLYVDDVNENKLVEEGIKAMVNQLDPHSAYLTAEEMKEMTAPLQGGFEGIGINFNMLNDTLISLK